VEENHAILHDTAYLAFEAIEESLRIDITMTTCRLADPVKSMGHENLSFARLAQYYATDAALGREIERFKGYCDSVLRRRNKLIAHHDLKTKLEPDSNLLPGIGRPDIEGIIASAAKALNIVAGVHADTEFRFEPPTLLDGKALVFWLKKALDADLRERGELE
jgi:hypothetical protein